MIDARRSQNGRTYSNRRKARHLTAISMPAAHRTVEHIDFDRTPARRQDPIGKTCLWIAPKTFACLTYPAQTAAGRRWFARLRRLACRICYLFTMSNTRNRPKAVANSNAPDNTRHKGTPGVPARAKGSAGRSAWITSARDRKNLTIKGPGGGSNRRHRKTLKNPRHREGFGGARRVRTDDLKLAKLPLSQLSYGPILDEIRASARAALGLATLRVDKPSCHRFASPTGRRRSLAGTPRERTFPPAFEASQE
jgi:hypothetical protein